MRIVIDRNIAFSSILNTNSKISKVILQPRSSLNLHPTLHFLQWYLENKFGDWFVTSVYIIN